MYSDRVELMPVHCIPEFRNDRQYNPSHIFYYLCQRCGLRTGLVGQEYNTHHYDHNTREASLLEGA